MSQILYYLLIKPLSLLPFWVLYRLSDLIFLLLYYIIPYRRKVVLTNLQNSFPEKSTIEIRGICRRFYRHLCDLIVESIKLFSITEKQILKRFTFLNPELANAFFEKGKSINLVGGHYNNWEFLALAIDKTMRHQAVAIYSPLSNPFFDRKMRESRSRFGTKLLSTREVTSYFANGFDIPCATLFGADQSPTHSRKVHWTRFLNQVTAVMLGTESFSKKYDIPVLYGRINKQGRGYYSFELELLFENPASTSVGEISEVHSRKLEEQILEQPELWLWTHKRWKRKFNPEKDKIYHE